MTGPGAWDQWLHWQNSTDDHRNRQAVQRELQKMLNSSPVSSPGAVSLVLSFLFSRNHAGQFTRCSQPCTLIPSHQKPRRSVPLVQSALHSHSVSSETRDRVSTPVTGLCRVWSVWRQLLVCKMGMGEIADLNTVRGCMDFEMYGVHHYRVKQELGELLVLTPLNGLQILWCMGLTIILSKTGTGEIASFARAINVPVCVTGPHSNGCPSLCDRASLQSVSQSL